MRQGKKKGNIEEKEEKWKKRMKIRKNWKKIKRKEENEKCKVKND